MICREVLLHPSSVLHGRNPPAKTVVFTEVLTTSRTYIRGVTAILARDLHDHLPHIFGPAPDTTAAS